MTKWMVPYQMFQNDMNQSRPRNACWIEYSWYRPRNFSASTIWIACRYASALTPATRSRNQSWVLAAHDERRHRVRHDGALGVGHRRLRVRDLPGELRDLAAHHQ